MAYSPKNPNGQATMANSEPVVIASDQSAVLVDLGANNDVTVTGTVTANLSATDNAVLDQIELNQDAQTALLTTIDADTSNLAAIETNTDSLAVVGGGVQATALRVTIASDSTGVISVDDNGGALTVDGTVTAELSATDNAVLDTIDAVLDTINAKLVTGTDIGDVTINNGAAAAAVNIQDGGNSITVDGTVGVSGTVTVDLGANNDVTVTSGTITANLGATDNAVLDQIELNQDSQTAILTTIDTDTGAMVTDLAAIEVLLGTIDTDTGSILTATQLLDDTVFADDAAVTLGTSKGNIAAGVAVVMDGTDPTAVSAEGDAAALRTDPNRLLLVNQTHPRFFRACVDYSSAQTNATVVAAPGAGLSLYITDLIISNGATAGNITLLDGSGGTLLFEIYPAINGGATHSFRNPIKLTANTLLAITSTTVTTHAVTVTGYIAA